jgi:hypothetical protein
MAALTYIPKKAKLFPVSVALHTCCPYACVCAWGPTDAQQHTRSLVCTPRCALLLLRTGASTIPHANALFAFPLLTESLKNICRTRALQGSLEPCPNYGHGRWHQRRVPASRRFSFSFAALTCFSTCSPTCFPIIFHALCLFLHRLLFFGVLIADFHQQDRAHQIRLSSFYDLVAIRCRFFLFKSSWICRAILPRNFKPYWHLPIQLFKRHFHQNSRTWIRLRGHVSASPSASLRRSSFNISHACCSP